MTKLNQKNQSLFYLEICWNGNHSIRLHKTIAVINKTKINKVLLKEIRLYLLLINYQILKKENFVPIILKLLI